MTSCSHKRATEFTFSYYFLHPTCVRFLAKCDNLDVERQLAEMKLLLDRRYTGFDLIS